MGKKIKIESICADYSKSKNHVFDIHGDFRDYDCHSTCVVWNHMTFYGIPFDLLDDRMEGIYQGDYREAVKIGELFGCLILCRQMQDEGEDPLVICEDIDDELGCVISALSDEEDGPLSLENGNSYQNVYYIHELTMEEDYDEKHLEARIVNELSGLVLTFCHVVPDILAFYPSLLEYAPDQDNGVIEQETPGPVPGPSISFDPIFGQVLTLDKRDPDLTRSAASYSEGLADSGGYEVFVNNGFKEVGDSGVLFKYVKG